MSNFKNKYLKYKSKYLQLKKIQEGGIDCNKVYQNKLGTCWAVAIQTIITFGQATSQALERVMKSLNFSTKNDFIETKIQHVISNSQLYDVFPHGSLDGTKHNYLKNILDKFIDRYYSKILEQKNPLAPKIVNSQLNTGRCELVISENFNKLFDNPIYRYGDYGGLVYDTYLFANILSIFFLDEKVSLTNYYDNFNSINFDAENDLGIIINLKNHACCLYICENKQRYYNDWNDEVYDCEWSDLLKKSCDLYIKTEGNFEIIDYDLYHNKKELSKVESLTLIKKQKEYSELDLDIINLLNSNYSNIKDKKLQYDIGCLYDTGIEGKNGYAGIAQNKEEAMKWFRRAVAQGYSNAQFKVGLMYFKGEGGVDEDVNEAMRWFYSSAKQGFEDAQCILGTMFDSGYKEAVKPNMKEAVRWYRLAAENGNIFAQCKMGNFFKDGLEDIIEQNMTEAVQWYLKAGNQENIYAQYILGTIFYNGEGNVPENKERAKVWFNAAATNGNAEAQFKLGLILSEDKGNPETIAEAEIWFRLAAEQGHDEAQCLLDIMLSNGKVAP